MTASACSAIRRAVDRSAGERWPRRSPGATTSCSPTTSGACGPSAASSVEHRSMVSSRSSLRWESRTTPPWTSSVGSSIGRSSAASAPARAPCGTGCSTASGPSRSSGSTTAARRPPRSARTRHGSPPPQRKPRTPSTGREDASNRATSRSRATSAPTSTPRSSGQELTTRSSACASRSTSGWVWVLIGDTQGAQRLSAALDLAEDAAPPELRAEGSLLLGWLHAAAGDVDLGHRTVAAAIETLPSSYDEHDRARADFVLAYVLSQEGEFDESLPHAGAVPARARRDAATRGARRANWVLTAHVALAAGDPAEAARSCAEAARLLADVGDPWFLVHTEAMLGAIAQAEHRFDDACDHLGRAADSSHGQGFASSEAYHRANLGRAQQQAGHLERRRGDAGTGARPGAGDGRPAGRGTRPPASRSRAARPRGARRGPGLRASRPGLVPLLGWRRPRPPRRLPRCRHGPRGARRSIAARSGARRRPALPATPRWRSSPSTRSRSARRRTGDLAAARALLELADAAMPAAQVRVTDDDRVDAIAARRLLG